MKQPVELFNWLLGVKFRRQAAIGAYIVDLFAPIDY
jgi:very-short-patch-repair endonuclease